MGVCLLNDSICNPDSRTLAGFDEEWVEKMGKLITPYIELFVYFLPICREFEKKVIYQKKVGVTAHLSE